MFPRLMTSRVNIAIANDTLPLNQMHAPNGYLSFAGRLLNTYVWLNGFESLSLAVHAVTVSPFSVSFFRKTITSCSSDDAHCPEPIGVSTALSAFYDKIGIRRGVKSSGWWS